VSSKRWQERIEDILEAIAETGTFVAGVTQAEFLADTKTQKAVVANLTIIGEAARHVPDAVAHAYPAIPWVLMRGMRNRIVHGYYQVDPTVVWDTCQNDLLPLVEPLKKLQQENP
jgi:uncharacterized protein with HEPN domain